MPLFLFLQTKQVNKVMITFIFGSLTLHRFSFALHRKSNN
jgi:hypothetical protein